MGPWGIRGLLSQYRAFLQNLHADSDNNMKLMYLKSRIGVTMEALAESLPCYSRKDFLVVHRKNNKGIWQGELWALRDFDAFEIQLGPILLPAQRVPPHGSCTSWCEHPQARPRYSY